MQTTNAVYPQPPSYNDSTSQGYSSNTNELPGYTPTYNPVGNYTNRYDDPAPPNNVTVSYNISLPAQTIPAPPSYIELPEEGFTTRTLIDDWDLRRKFVQKVYSILFLQLLLTVGIVSIFTFVEEVREFMSTRFYLILVSGGVVLFVFIAVAHTSSGRRLQRKYPENIAIVLLLTVTMALFAGTIASFVRTEAVIFAFVISAGVCLLISILTLLNAFDFTLGCVGYFVVTVLVLICFGIVSAITFSQIWYIHVVYGFIVAIIFGWFLAYDTRSVIAKNDDLTTEDYIAGAIHIYADILLIFLLILVCIGGGGGGQ